MNRYLLIVVAVSVFCLIAFAALFQHPPGPAAPYTGPTALTFVTSAATKTPVLSIGGRIALEDALRSYAASEETKGDLSTYAIYFHDLNDGPTIGIHETTDFSPASLLKLPVALWYYKQAESNPGYLDNEIQFTGPKGTSIEHYPPQATVEVGNTYTLRELIALMMQESDNDATAILTQYAGGRDPINSVYTDLGITGVEDYNTYVIDVHTYASFLKVLYDATYLNRTDSNELLSVMAGASFTEGLTAGVPSGVPIAHKFGEHVVSGATGINELHDCGIVYAKARPYLLCVMTQGKDYPTLAAFIAGVSKDVYAAMTATSTP